MTAPAPVLCSSCQSVLAPSEIDSRPGVRPECTKCATARAGNPSSPFAILMMVVGGVAGLYGIVLTFQDPSSSDKLVGGDAFNFQIYAARGLVVMAGGILLVLLGLTAATLSNYRRP